MSLPALAKPVWLLVMLLHADVGAVRPKDVLQVDAQVGRAAAAAGAREGGEYVAVATNSMGIGLWVPREHKLAHHAHHAHHAPSRPTSRRSPATNRPAARTQKSLVQKQRGGSGRPHHIPPMVLLGALLAVAFLALLAWWNRGSGSEEEKPEADEEEDHRSAVRNAQGERRDGSAESPSPVAGRGDENMTALATAVSWSAHGEGGYGDAQQRVDSGTAMRSDGACVPPGSDDQKVWSAPGDASTAAEADKPRKTSKVAHIYSPRLEECSAVGPRAPTPEKGAPVRRSLKPATSWRAAG